MAKFRYGDPAQANRTRGELIQHGKPTRQRKLRKLYAISRNIRALTQKAFFEAKPGLRKRATTSEGGMQTTGAGDEGHQSGAGKVAAGAQRTEPQDRNASARSR